MAIPRMDTKLPRNAWAPAARWSIPGKPSKIHQTGMRSGDSAQHRAQMLGAGPHVVDRPLFLGFLGEDGVLFQDVPAVVPAGGEMRDDGLDIDVTRAERAVYALTDGLGVGESTGLDLGSEGGVHVLHVG